MKKNKVICIIPARGSRFEIKKSSESMWKAFNLLSNNRCKKK